MAKKQESKKKVEKLEREYNVPLRRDWLKAPKYKRAKRAVHSLQDFLAKHMKCEDIKLGPKVNELIWKEGIKNPPHHVKIKAIRTEDDQVHAELVGFTYVVKKKVEKEEKTKLEQAAEKFGVKAPKKVKKEEVIEEKREEAVKEKAETAKEIQKEEIDELKKEVKVPEYTPAPADKSREDDGLKHPEHTHGSQKMPPHHGHV